MFNNENKIIIKKEEYFPLVADRELVQQFTVHGELKPASTPEPRFGLGLVVTQHPGKVCEQK